MKKTFKLNRLERNTVSNEPAYNPEKEKNGNTS